MIMTFARFVVASFIASFGFSLPANAWQKTYKNGTYTGAQRGGKPHGQGVFKWNSGRYKYFKGLFIFGRINGAGTMYYRDGSSCFGEFNNKLQINSNARCKYASGAVYSGNMSRGKRHLRGTYYYANGNEYNGQWKYGRKHGKGTYIVRKNGIRVSIMRSLYRDGKKQGWASLRFYESGNNYCIKFRDNKVVVKKRSRPNVSCPN